MSSGVARPIITNLTFEYISLISFQIFSNPVNFSILPIQRKSIFFFSFLLQIGNASIAAPTTATLFDLELTRPYIELSCLADERLTVKTRFEFLIIALVPISHSQL